MPRAPAIGAVPRRSAAHARRGRTLWPVATDTRRPCTGRCRSGWRGMPDPRAARGAGAALDRQRLRSRPRRRGDRVARRGTRRRRRARRPLSGARRRRPPGSRGARRGRSRHLRHARCPARGCTPSLRYASPRRPMQQLEPAARQASPVARIARALQEPRPRPPDRRRSARPRRRA